MRNKEIKLFKSGTHSRLNSEVIPQDAAQDAKNWVTKDGAIELVRGKVLVNSDLGSGAVYGEIFGYKVNGTKVHWIKSGTEIGYDNGTTFTPVVTGLSATTDYTFANYSSLAGAFTFAFGPDGIFKFNNANPDSYIALWSTSTPNYKGWAIIDKGQTFLWRSDTDRTGLYRSKIDQQKVGTQYTQVTAEILSGAHTTAYSGTLAFKGGGATRNCFAISITGTTGVGAETFTDSYNGTLTSNAGGTGTINYITGAYSVTFANAVTSGNVTATYQWEDSNASGLTDFRSSSPRIAAEGMVIPQDEGGDPIYSVQIGTDGKYYTFKQQSVYSLAIDNDDLAYTNEVYRRNIGLPSMRAVVATGKGIVFMNTANAADPQMTILQRNPIADNVEPMQLFQHFQFNNYDYTDCTMSTWDRFILVFCRSQGATTNDTILLCDVGFGTVDILKYNGRTAATDGQSLYMGSSLSRAVYKLFDGYDDDGFVIDNYWISKDENQGESRLKKIRFLRLRGLIDPNQSYEVYGEYDLSGYALLGTVVGTGSYVSSSTGISVGSSGVGTEVVGGASTTTVYPYELELKLKTPKHRIRNFKFVAKGFGYVNINYMADRDIFLYEDKLSSRFRTKQNVSLDGLTTDLSTPQF